MKLGGQTITRINLGGPGQQKVPGKSGSQAFQSVALVSWAICRG